MLTLTSVFMKFSDVEINSLLLLQAEVDPIYSEIAVASTGLCSILQWDANYVFSQGYRFAESVPDVRMHCKPTGTFQFFQ